MRGIYIAMAAGAAYVGLAVLKPVPLRDLSSIGVVLAASAAQLVSWLRRDAGVSGQAEVTERRTARVAAMTGIDRARDDPRRRRPTSSRPRSTWIAPVIGAVGIVAAGLHAGHGGGSDWLAVARFLVGAAFLGAVTDAMLLGHWYLVQPGLARGPLLELVRWTGYLWLPEVVLLLIPVGMVSVLDGHITDDYNGLLGWFWVACAVTTVGLVIVTRLALKERYYSAVMAATGLLYLAILTAFGTDLVARALLS